MPAFLAFNALVASLLAIFAPAAAGTPIDTNASTILPAARCSAISSNGFIVSNTCSTFAAAFSVNSNASISSAPRDTKPSGIFNTPDATPASAASICDTSWLSSASVLRGSNGELEMLMSNGSNDSAIYVPYVFVSIFLFANVFLS